MKKWLIIYDIKHARRLVRVMKIVNEYATRVQLSVYEMEDTDYAVGRIIERVEKVIDKAKDFVAYFELCETDWQKRDKFGRINELGKQSEFYII